VVEDVEEIRSLDGQADQFPSTDFQILPCIEGMS